jgi:hypothetical protein
MRRLSAGALWALGLSAVGCAPFTPLDDGLSKYDPTEQELAFPNARVDGEGVVDIETADGGTAVVPFVVQEGFAVADGDILLGAADAMMNRSAGVDTASRLWNTCAIPYSFDASLTDGAREDFLEAVAHWEANTALTFVEDASASTRIRVKNGSGCSSYVGRRGGVQDLTLSQWCGRGAAIHEIGHAIGLWHEQSRSDADDHVTKHWDNIPNDKAHNFRTYEQRWQPGVDLGPYDTGSIMHYSSGAFATGTCWSSDTSGCTITHLDGSYLSEHQRIRLSSGDLAGIDALYGDQCGAPAQDDHGDGPDDATPVSGPSSTVQGSVEAADDDWFRVDLPAGHALELASTGDTDTFGTLYAADGTTELASDDDSGADRNFALSLAGEAHAGGPLYLKVRGYSESTTGPYALQVTTTAPPDDHGNDQPTATEVRFEQYGVDASSNLLDAGDVDVFRIEALVGGALTAFSEGSTDTHGTLYAADGTQLDLDDDGGTGLNFAVTSAVEPGTYFLHVRGYSTSTSGPYDLEVALQAD